MDVNRKPKLVVLGLFIVLVVLLVTPIPVPEGCHCPRGQGCIAVACHIEWQAPMAYQLWMLVTRDLQNVRPSGQAEAQLVRVRPTPRMIQVREMPDEPAEVTRGEVIPTGEPRELEEEELEGSL
jgi:hypothetical protein